MKKFLIFLLLMAPVFAGLTYDGDYYMKHRQTALSGSKTSDPIYLAFNELDALLGGSGGFTSLLFTPGTAPTEAEGLIYYDAVGNILKFYNGSSWVSIESGSTGNSLDGAYDVGSAISADNGSVTITASNAADNAALSLVQEDTGATVGASITSAGTGALLAFDSNGTGADILGSDSTWNVSKAGVGTFVGLVTSTGDVTFTGAAANIIHDASANQLEFQDAARLVFGTSDDIIIAYDGAGNDLDILGSGLEIAFGASDEGIDVILHGETASTNVTWDESADELVFNLADLKISQGSQIEFIDVTDGATDWTIDNATDETLLFYPTETTDDQSINFGNATNTTDFRLFGATASTVIFDASADNVIFNAYDIQLNDDDVLAFGDGKDVIISQSSANLLTIGQTVAGTGSVAFGVNDAGLDVKMFGDTASAYWLWDTSADTMEVVGGNVTIATDDAEANQFKVNATGAVAGIAIQLETTDGGIHLLADGATGGDITLDAEDDIILTTTGKLTITNTEAATFSGAATIAGVLTANGTIVGDGGTTLTGTISTVEAYTGANNVITIAEAGSVFTNTGDADGSMHTLPEASTAIGMKFTFVVTVAQALVVDLDNADKFLHLTLDAGDKITSSTIGDTITVMAVSASEWAVISAYPASTDWADGGE